jgi:hypothetical protein
MNQDLNGGGGGVLLKLVRFNDFEVRHPHSVNQITKYSRHVYSHNTAILAEAILNDFNAIRPKLQFTAEEERDNTLNYLDISIHRTPTNLKTSIYRKSTFTDIIIPYISNHPTHSTSTRQSNLQTTD